MPTNQKDCCFNLGGATVNMTKNRVNEIDLLRFLAALSVVLYHYSFRGYAANGMSIMPYPLLAPLAKYGSLGVELFFMISGFVILMTAADGSLKNFIISRIVRLYPAFWACCTITFMAIVLMDDPRFSASMGQYLVNMTLLSKFFKVPSIDGVYWSLFVEIRFYALVAFILLIKMIRQAQLFLIFWLLLSVVLVVIPVDKLRYIFIVDYSAYFIAGSTFFLVWSRGLSLQRCFIIISSWCLAIYQSSKYSIGFEKQFNTILDCYMVYGVITMFFVIMFLISMRRTGFIGRNRWVLVGVLTYPLYLLHQNIGFMIFNFAYPAINNHILLWGTIVLMLVVSYSVNMFVERRFSLPMKSTLNRLFNSIHRLTTRCCELVKIRR